MDLFGLPDDPGRGLPGRPRKIATPEDRSLVNMLLAFGKKPEEVAEIVGMSMPTFRRNFFQEIKARHLARERLKARVLMVAIGEAMGGNMQAAKLVLARLEAEDRRIAAEMYGDPIDAKPVSPDAPQGKKAQRMRDAENAGRQDSIWGNDLAFPGVRPN